MFIHIFMLFFTLAFGVGKDSPPPHNSFLNYIKSFIQIATIHWLVF